MMKLLIFVAVLAYAQASMGNIPNAGSIFSSTESTPLPPEVDDMKVRQYFADSCEERLNEHIKYEFFASQVYLSMSTYLSRWDVALPGFAKKFRGFSDEEREHGIIIMNYINKRGGLAKMPLVLDVSEYRSQIESNHWGDIMNVLQVALKTERLVNHRLVDFVRTCADKQNYHMENFIDDTFLTEQVDAIHELGRMITEIKMIGTSHLDNYGLYQYDQRLLK